MAEQELFHMQLHPQSKHEVVEYARKGLARTRAIGLDFGDTAERIIVKKRLSRKPLTDFSDSVIDELGRAGEYKKLKKKYPKESRRQIERRVQKAARRAATYLKQFRDLRPGAVGLIRGGNTPVALVKVTQTSFYGRRVNPWGWYRYRYPVQILGWYEEDKLRWPDIQFNPPAPGTFQLLKGRSNLRKAIDRWLGHLGVDPRGLVDQRTPDNGSEDDPGDDDGFLEGKEAYQKHRTRERSAKLARLAKARAMKEEGRLLCKACGFDFAKRYGTVGHGYIECHHTLPVSELKPNQRTKLKDVALLCSNCHRMVHRRRPWLAMKKLSLLLAHK
jgi:5-methylcytosine-specific restriction endonuclease McrA